MTRDDVGDLILLWANVLFPDAHYVDWQKDEFCNVCAECGTVLATAKLWGGDGVPWFRPTARLVRPCNA
jgi:hypothetical protein